MKYDPDDHSSEKILCGMVSFLLLKNGYTVDSVSKSMFVPLSFVTKMYEAGIHNGLLQQAGDKICPKQLRCARPSFDQFMAFLRRSKANEMPADLFCQNFGLTFPKEIVDVEEKIERYSNFDPLRFMNEKTKRRVKNPIKVFVESKCEIAASNQCDVKTLFIKWKSFREKHNLKEFTVQSLSKKLRELYPSVETVQYRTKESENGFSRKYIGIGLKQKPEPQLS